MDWKRVQRVAVGIMENFIAEVPEKGIRILEGW